METLSARGEMRNAGIGRVGSSRTQSDVRNDCIHWIEPDGDNAADNAAHDFAKSLCTALNAQLFLSLDHAELHYAHYAPGGHYSRHVDRHSDSNARVISFVLYLNETWQDDWGGALQLYDPQSEAILTSVAPTSGTLVLFRSETFPHEVFPATYDRLSLTGWLRRHTA